MTVAEVQQTVTSIAQHGETADEGQRPYRLQWVGMTGLDRSP
jgi:hypothetical protein